MNTANLADHNDMLRDLASAAGIQAQWTDNEGAPREVGVETLHQVLAAMGMPCQGSNDALTHLSHLRQHKREAFPLLITADAGEVVTLPQAFFTHAGSRACVILEDGRRLDRILQIDVQGRPSIGAIELSGYHRLETGGRSVILAVAPPRCWSIADSVGAEKIWGAAAQIYALRHDLDSAGYACGTGDFAAVRACAAALARHGADALALSPSHALFGGDAGHYSPYSPSNRCFLNVLYAAPGDVFDEARLKQAAHKAHLSESACLDDNRLIEWRQSGMARLDFLRALFEDFMQHDLAHNNALAQDFLRFCNFHGEWLDLHATFEALHLVQFRRDSGKWHWRDWPQPFRSPDHRSVKVFAQANQHEIMFHKFAQWLAGASLARAQTDACTSGMRIGLIGDLAIGLNSGGSHAWAAPQDLLTGLSIGAPPDALAPRGQDWGLCAFSPLALRASGFAPFIATLRAALRHAGGLRIDHVMGLARLWLIPESKSSGEGAYVSFPETDLLRLIALESLRARAIIIGEDLGTVPHGMRDRLAAKSIAGMRVLLFEQDDFVWRAGADYPAHAAAMTSTHDTATMAGFWSGLDLERRAQCAQLPPGQSREQAALIRQREREGMMRAMTGERGPRALPDGADRAGESAQFVDHAVRFVAQSAAQIVIVPLEDIIAQDEQPNLPGTIHEHPNWRRRYPAGSEALLDQLGIAQRLTPLARRRPRAKDGQSSDPARQTKTPA